MRTIFSVIIAVGVIIAAYSPAAGQDESDDSFQPDQQVMVVAWQAPLLVDGKAIGKAQLGDTFIVENVNDDSVLVKSRGFRLKKSDVLPSDDVIPHFTKKIEADASPVNYLIRGNCWLQRGEIDKALNDFNEALRIEPKYPAAYVCRGRAWAAKREFGKAFSDLDTSLQLNPNFYAGYINRGITFCEKGERDKGIVDFNKAIQLQSDNAQAYFERGFTKEMLGDPDAAIVDFGIAIRLGKNDLRTYYHRARSFTAKGAYEMALADYKEAIRIDRAIGLNMLAWVHATSTHPELRDGHQAVEEATEACEISNWKNSNHIDTLSAALAEAGRFDEAVKRLQEAIDMSPNASKEVREKMMAAFKASKPYRSED